MVLGKSKGCSRVCGRQVLVRQGRRRTSRRSQEPADAVHGVRKGGTIGRLILLTSLPPACSAEHVLYLQLASFFRPVSLRCNPDAQYRPQQGEQTPNHRRQNRSGRTRDGNPGLPYTISLVLNPILIQDTSLQNLKSVILESLLWTSSGVFFASHTPGMLISCSKPRSKYESTVLTRQAVYNALFLTGKPSQPQASRYSSYDGVTRHARCKRTTCRTHAPASFPLSPQFLCRACGLETKGNHPCLQNGPSAERRYQ